jgi:hypothetical protein
MAPRPSFGHHWPSSENPRFESQPMLSDDYGYNRGPLGQSCSQLLAAGRDSSRILRRQNKGSIGLRPWYTTSMAPMPQFVRRIVGDD